MEIEFSHVTYYNSKNKNNKNLVDVSFLIKKNSIVGIVSNYDNSIMDLLSLEKRPSIGSIRFDDVIINKSNKIDKKTISNKIGIAKYYTRNTFLAKSVKEELLITLRNYGINKDVDKKIDYVIKIVGFNPNILNRDPNSLSSSEKNKLSLAIALSYNPKILVLDNIELGLSYKEKENLKRLLRVLKNKYNKTIIVLSNDMDFLKNIVDNYLVINNGNLIVNDKSCYNSDIYEYTDMPLLIDFIKYVRSEGHNIDEYVDIKELIKAIYRDVSK